jgi:hypothetical protein
MRGAAFFIAACGLLAGCTEPRVTFKAQTSPVTDFNDAGVSFRIPRSQISIAPKSGSSGVPLVPTVIDPVPTVDKIPLPLNEKNNYYYTLQYTPPDPTGFTNASFRALIATGPQKGWPIPTCGTATITLYSSNQYAQPPDLAVTAVPTELDYPTAPGMPATTESTLYRATGADDLLSTTALKVTYLPNTKIIQTIGTTVTDHVVDDIKTVTTIAAAAAAFAAPSAPTETAEYKLAVLTVRVADNRTLEAMRLPSNGSITMNPTCGADRTDAGTGGPAAVANDLAQIMTDVQSAYQAWTKSKSSPTPPSNSQPKKQ